MIKQNIDVASAGVGIPMTDLAKSKRQTHLQEDPTNDVQGRINEGTRGKTEHPRGCTQFRKVYAKSAYLVACSSNQDEIRQCVIEGR
jgi:hypothetical protein